MPVINFYTGNFLKYFQLCTHPKLSKIWNESSFNEMGRLCQGIGTVPDGAGQRVKGTDTFHIIY